MKLNKRYKLTLKLWNGNQTFVGTIIEVNDNEPDSVFHNSPTYKFRTKDKQEFLFDENMIVDYKEIPYFKYLLEQYL